MSLYDDDGDFEPNGNRLDDETVRLADRRGPPPRQPDRFGRGFDAQALETAEDCRQSIEELDEIIAQITGSLEAFAGQDLTKFPPERASWLVRANHALAHKRRMRGLIGQRAAQLTGMVKGRSQNEINAMIVERQALAHQQKLERIKAANSRQGHFVGVLARLVRARFGDAAWTDLAQDADDITGREFAE